MKVWLDIENPPQVQYLLPLKRAFEDARASTVITARDYGDTLEMLEQAGVSAFAAGSQVGKGKVRKVAGTMVRARRLARFLDAAGRPDVAISASRAASLVAWQMRMPNFLIGDYEYASTAVCRLTRATLLHPDVIDQQILRGRGLRQSQLVPFRGLKEDLTFAGEDVDAIEPYDLGIERDESTVRVLFRPPSETSHYYREASSSFARTTLEYLARGGAQVVVSPRAADQTRMLDGLQWRHDPVVLRRPVAFVSLLKSVDLVVCSGGTMLREAAYVGIPAYSIFQSEIGAVDRWLEKIGRACLITGPDELGKIALTPRGPLRRLDSNPHLVADIVALVRDACSSDALAPPSGLAA